MRKVIGSEKDVRANSKKVIKESKDGREGQGMFSKSSFHDFQERKFKEFLSEGSEDIFAKVEKQLEAFKEQAYLELDRELKRNLLTPRSHRKKGEEIERWADMKRRELVKQVEPLSLHLKTIMDNLVRDKEAIIDKIGVSPRQQHRRESVGASRSKDESSSLDYLEVEEEQSDESQNTKYVRDQISRFARMNNYVEEGGADMSESAKFDMKIKKKKALAKKLIEEKERIIKQGIKDKLRSAEADQADKMVSLALRIDTNAEIEKRLKDKRRQIEDSSEQLESARSYGLSQSGAPSEGKKKVQFASPEKYRSSVIDDSSNRFSNSKVEDSIGESIYESYRSDSRHHTEQNSSSHQDKRQGVVRPQDSIKEDVNESKGSSSYPEDFEESKHSHSTPNRKRLSNYDRSGTDSNYIEEDFIGESMPESKDLQKSGPLISVTNADGEIKTIIDSSDHQEIVSQSAQEVDIDKTSQYGSSIAQPQMDQESEDQEVVVSSNSIQWEIDLKKPDLVQKSTESYQEDFHDEQSEKSEKPAPPVDEPSYPESEEDILDQAEAFTEEFMDILIKGIEEECNLKVGEAHDEELFKNKFPFNLKEPEPVEEPKPLISSPKPAAVEPLPSQEELARKKYEEDLRRIQENFDENMRYLDLVIDNIDRTELI